LFDSRQAATPEGNAIDQHMSDRGRYLDAAKYDDAVAFAELAHERLRPKSVMLGETDTLEAGCSGSLHYFIRRGSTAVRIGDGVGVEVDQHRSVLAIMGSAVMIHSCVSNQIYHGNWLTEVRISRFKPESYRPCPPIFGHHIIPI